MAWSLIDRGQRRAILFAEWVHSREEIKKPGRGKYRIGRKVDESDQRKGVSR
jgi:hypothetical protein